MLTYLFFVQHRHLPNSFDLIAGTGKEENKNNMYILKASFCQPSGLCVSHVQNENDKAIYVADSESSTIRVINAAGRVMPLVGGSKDPSVFCYINLTLPKNLKFTI